MDIFTAIQERRSCRKFLNEPVGEEVIEKILEAATWAPSPLNLQPWEFIVITNGAVKDKIFAESIRCKAWALEESGWKWIGGYKVDFLKSAPVIVAVIGDPKKSGVDMFMEGGRTGYQHACAAAIQNMLLAAHASGLGGIWFTFFDKKPMREILGVDEKKTPIALICLGKPDGKPTAMPRKSVKDKTSYMA
ncbi:MAG: nitroreductase family protein [Deltaproteobacteria bacterium]|nr:nitroreductase family protein [Deltaproteobacteria bacterium]